MADKLLKSITFPDLTDKYIIGDTSLSVAGAGADAKATGDALATKAEVDGSYESMTVGNAEQLVSNVRVNDKTPYLFRTSGGSVDIGDREYVNGIVGGTIAWNQLVEHGDFDDISGWQKQSLVDSISVASNVLTATINGGQNEASWKYAVFRNVAGIPFGASDHYYFCTWDINPSVATTVRLELGGSVKKESGTLTANSWNTVAFIAKKGSINQQVYTYPQSAVAGVTAPSMTMKYRNVMCIDLTQMFGSTIADYIYSLETATAGAGVAWFKKLFNKPYYAYNAGELKSVSGLVSHDMTGFNQWDEVWEVGDINNSGEPVGSTSYHRSKNFCPCLPSTTYYKCSATRVWMFFYDADFNFIEKSSNTQNTTITTPSNAHYFKIVVDADAGNICINISWDGSRNGEYEPYELHSYPLDSDLTLRGIPKLDANNNLYYDGDVYEADGTVTRKYKAVTIDGSDTFSYQYNGTLLSGYIACFINFADKAYGIYNMLSDKFVSNNNSELYTVCGRVNNGGVQYVLPSTVTASNEGCKAWFTSNPTHLVYELATPTTETADPYQQTEIVSDFGTEEFVISDNTFAVPVGHDTEYPIDLRAKLEMAPNSPSDGDGDYIVRQTNGVNEYVPLVIEDALPTIPSTAGTYTLTVTVTDGADPVLSWEA